MECIMCTYKGLSAVRSTIDFQFLSSFNEIAESMIHNSLQEVCCQILKFKNSFHDRTFAGLYMIYKHFGFLLDECFVFCTNLYEICQNQA